MQSAFETLLMIGVASTDARVKVSVIHFPKPPYGGLQTGAPCDSVATSRHVSVGVADNLLNRIGRIGWIVFEKFLIRASEAAA